MYELDINVYYILKNDYFHFLNKNDLRVSTYKIQEFFKLNSLKSKKYNILHIIDHI